MAAMANYSMGIEVEMRMKPHKIREPLIEKHALYYEKLAAALRNRGLRAKANDLSGGSRYTDSYDKWWITRDGSLGNPEGLIPMEAVSPILEVRGNWAQEIDTFWAAARAVFHMPERSRLCGSHVHVSNGRTTRFTLPQMKRIAYGIVIYEPLLLECLMADRQINPYCKPNTQASSQLRRCNSNGQVLQLIAGASNAQSLRSIMQNDRQVLWNFDNTLPGKSGTIEFRGGRFLRGEARTKRWIAFVVSFIHMLLSEGNLNNPGFNVSHAWTPAALYVLVKNAAQQLGMRQYLPQDHMVLNESRRA